MDSQTLLGHCEAGVAARPVLLHPTNFINTLLGQFGFDLVTQVGDADLLNQDHPLYAHLNQALPTDASGQTAAARLSFMDRVSHYIARLLASPAVDPPHPLNDQLPTAILNGLKHPSGLNDQLCSAIQELSLIHISEPTRPY